MVYSYGRGWELVAPGPGHILNSGLRLNWNGADCRLGRGTLWDVCVV